MFILYGRSCLILVDLIQNVLYVYFVWSCLILFDRLIIKILIIEIIINYDRVQL